MEKIVSSPHQDPKVISIVELDFHYDCLDSLIKIFQNHTGKIHVFTTLENMRLLSEIKYNENVIFHPYKPFSKFLFLLKNRNFLKSSDFIFINTIATNFGAYLAVPNPSKTILRIHNINKQFIPFQSITRTKTLLGTWKFCSYIGREVILKLFPIFSAVINKRIQYFTFPDNGLKDYAILKKFIPIEKTIESIPFKVFQSSNIPALFEKELVISIMGATDESRRNYREIITALQKIYQEKSPAIKLILLGKAKGTYGNWILEELKQISDKNFTLKYFTENVPEDEFVKLAGSAHLVLSPIVAETKTDIFKEVYGTTKTSGSILDFIKFGTVTITPDFYNPPKEMQVFFQKYADVDDLAQKILYFYENPAILNQLNRQSKAFVAEQYNIEKIYTSSMNSLQSILNKK